jgi:hypothetical protein
MVIAVALAVPILIVPPVPLFAAPASRTNEPLVPVELLFPPKMVTLAPVPEEVLFPGWIVRAAFARVVISGA